MNRSEGGAATGAPTSLLFNDQRENRLCRAGLPAYKAGAVPGSLHSESGKSNLLKSR